MWPLLVIIFSVYLGNLNPRYTGFVLGRPQDEDLSLDHGNSIETDKIGLPIYTTLNGSVTNLNEILPKISLNRTKAFLNCSQGSMQVELMFQEPFFGIAYADYDRNSACLTKGKGLDTARIELPLKGCGTLQDPPRVFTNNIVVRFHPSLEMDGDEVITIVCRYPPAVALRPGPVIPAPIQSLPPPTPALTGIHLLIIICSLVFLALLLTGLGCSYMCLKNRVVGIHEIHRQVIAGSEITKFSGSTFSNISMFTGYKIPRALVSQQAYGSEAHLVMEHSDTLPSDYPSESHSERSAYYAEYLQVDEERSLPVSSAGSYENKAFTHHQQSEQRASSSLYSENINEIETTAVQASRLTQQRHPVAVSLEPKFDVRMRVKCAPPTPSPLPSESEASLALERNLTTILEREESSRMTEAQNRLSTFAYTPEIHAPPSTSRQQTPPVYSRILRKQAERETTNETMQSTATTHRPRSLASVNTEMTETRSITEVTDSSHAKYRLAPQNSKLSHLSEEYREMSREEVEPLVEPIVSPRRPEITTHEVDDVFLRTVTDKKTIEEIERHRRMITEYRAKQQLMDPKWDVTIRNYPGHEVSPQSPEWENFSDVSSASNLTITNEQVTITKTMDEPIDVHIKPTYTSRTQHLSDETERSTSSMYNLERVLEPQFATELTEDERKKWREVITTESTLKTLLTEAVVKEDYELIKKDSRYLNLFPSEKWDVIIRIINPPNNGSASSSSHGKSGQRYKRGKSSEWDNRSRRSSLPTLYEYESDGGSSRAFGQDHLRHTAGPGVASRIRKLSSTRGGSEADLRSMSEMTVRDFVTLRGERDDLTSLSSFEGESLIRSLSQPSLARSGSEFTEHWGLPPCTNLPNWALDDEACSSTDTTPRPLRREFGDLSRQDNPNNSYARSTRYSEKEESSSYKTKEGRKRGSWFNNDDSEPEMQI